MNSEQKFFLMNGGNILFMLVIIGLFIWFFGEVNILAIGVVGMWAFSEYYHRVISYPSGRSIGRTEGRLIELKRFNRLMEEAKTKRKRK